MGTDSGGACPKKALFEKVFSQKVISERHSEFALKRVGCLFYDHIYQSKHIQSVLSREQKLKSQLPGIYDKITDKEEVESGGGILLGKHGAM